MAKKLTLAGAADELYTIREQRLKLQKQVDALAAEETVLRDYLINNLPKTEATGVAGKLARATIVTKPVPQVKDWDRFYAYVKKTNSFELLQKRLGEGAIKERWEAGKDVPGVEKFNAVTVSLNKV
jgi:hypothetical protein